MSVKRSKTNYEVMNDIPKNDNHVKWHHNPKCKFKHLVQAIEQDKRLNGEED